jgi:capsular exopolysaccharide synthesis family protein
MGTVPALPSGSSREAVLAGSKSAEQVLWEHLVDESVDSTRTLFLHTADANDLHVVAVTSAVGGEGKTSLSCQLAKSVARSGRRVLLIDADLRNPSVHEVFAIGLQPGVSECLRSELTHTAAIRETSIPNLCVFTAGRCDVRAIQQLAMDGFRRLLEEVRRHYDFVLIDSCPVLPVADALLISRHVDGVLLSLMCDVSQVERAQVASRKLTSVGARVIGAVVHGTNPDSYGYGPRYLAPVQAS